MSQKQGAGGMLTALRRSAGSRWRPLFLFGKKEKAQAPKYLRYSQKTHI
jgi:hypothetical protein